MNKFLKNLWILKEFYPAQLVLLVFAPIIIGSFIDYELLDSRYIIINLIWLSLFTVPAALLKSKYIYRITVLVYFVLGFIEISHWIILQGPLTITSILVLSNTNYQEAVEFLDLKATAGLLVLIPYIFILIYSFRNTPKYQQSQFKLYAAGLLLLISLIFIVDNVVNGRFIRKSTPQIVKVTLSFFDQIKLYHELKIDVSPREIAIDSEVNSNTQTFVLIIGESCNRKHMSLYGALRPTTPKLDSRNDLLVFKDVISPYSNTINSVLTILSQSNLENKISFKNSIDILDVFSSAGYKTYWLSNQPPLGVWENMVTIFANKADQRYFTNTVSNSSMEATLTTSYDSKLFAPFSKTLNEDANKKLIVLHLMGNHSSYAKRYPSDFDVFEGSGKQENIIAQYDNSIYYNDFVVDSLLNILNEFSTLNSNNIASAIYLSDHGENVYDELNRVGHDYSNVLPKANVEIPFLVWVSPAYLKINSSKVSAMRSNIDKPYVSDDLFHSIMDLNNINCEYFEEKRSLINMELDTTRIRILEDGKDYDRK
jgi:heptose-I-phosphate ethanolaminephosphotransferase